MNLVETLVRDNIKSLTPYGSARDEFNGQANVYLDANENPYPKEFNRYPDPYQRKLKERLASLKGIRSSQLFLGNGSDEIIDLLIRAFCEPGRDAILIAEPTYGMYRVCSEINDVKVQSVMLNEQFDLDLDLVLSKVSPATKIIFLCSPNNPTGNLLERSAIESILKGFNGLVVVDEAYIDFSSQPGFVPLLDKYSNLVVMQTLSKAWGLAGLRLGICFSSEEIIKLLTKIKYPYNINTYTQKKVLEILQDEKTKKSDVEEILSERKRLESELKTLDIVKHVYKSEANFLLVKMNDADRIYYSLLDQGIVVRNRSQSLLCTNCLRITVGTPEENDLLISKLKEL